MRRARSSSFAASIISGNSATYFGGGIENDGGTLTVSTCTISDNKAYGANGGGIGNSIAALGKPATAGFGAFGGVLSTARCWVFVDMLVTLLFGALLGFLSVKITSAITPKPATHREERPAEV